MPCRGPDVNDYARDNQKIQKLVDQLTQDLCYLTASLEADGLLKKYASERIYAWFLEHKRQDLHRVTNEMNMMAANHRKKFYKPEEVASYFIKKAEKEHPVSNFHKEWFLKIATEISEKIIKEDKLISSAKLKLTTEEMKILGIKK